MNTATQGEIDIDGILDGTLDDLADMPSFKPFPNGAHVCTIKFERKKIGTHPAVEVTLTLVETKELANAGDTPPEKGDESSCAYMLDVEMGQGKFKELMANFAAHFGGEGKKLSDLMAEAQGCEVLAITTQRENKKVKGQFFMDITGISVV